MRTYDFSPLWRSTVGFDRMFDLINNEVPDVQDTYPPYDIVRTGEESYRISLALAGFTPEQITVTAQQNRLTVSGSKSDNGKQEYLFQSIAARLSSATSASRTTSRSRERRSRTGLLQIDLVRKVPEAMKPRRIEISVGHDVAKSAKTLEARDTKSRPAVKAA